VNKKITNNFKLGIITVSMAILLSGCATNKTKADAANAESTQNYVDQQMLKVAQSVDGNLQDLLRTTRGNEAPRSTVKPIASTVAGNTGSGLLSRPTISVSPVTLGGGTQITRNEIAKSLDEKVKINWNGEAADLLRTISGKIGFSFFTVGSGSAPKVKINANNETVKSVLGQVANQVNGSADVQVDIKTKTIKLVYR
jgi:hypothetical protein